MNDATRIPQSECPTCHYKMDATTAVFEKATPKKGDISVCMKCGTVTQFDEKLRMVALTSKEVDEIKEKYPALYIQIRQIQREIAKKFAKRN